MSYYNKISAGYDKLHQEEQIEKTRLIKENCFLKGLILDIGAGTGAISKLFEGEGNTVIALDPAKEMLVNYKDLKLIARAEELPFKDACFDSIVSLTALHHADIKLAKKEIDRVSKKGATVAISFFKRAKNFAEAKRIFSSFKEIDSEKDLIFIKQ